MRKTQLLALALPLLFLAIIGCKKESAVLVPVPVINSWSISPTGTLPYGETPVFERSTTNATSVKLNGVSFNPNGSDTLSRVFSDTSFTLIAYGDDGASEPQTKTVTVGDWTTSDYGIISHNYWLYDSLAYEDPTSSSGWHYYGPGQPWEQRKFYFLPSGEYREVNINNPNDVWIGKWTHSGKNLTTAAIGEVPGGGRKFLVELVTPIKLVLKEDVPDFYTGEILVFRWVYKRSAE